MIEKECGYGVLLFVVEEVIKKCKLKKMKLKRLFIVLYLFRKSFIIINVCKIIIV